MINKDQDIVACMARIARFYKHDCGQCTPCREGSGWMWRILDRTVKGKTSYNDISLLDDVTKQIEGHTIYCVWRRISLASTRIIKTFQKRDRG